MQHKVIITNMRQEILANSDETLLENLQKNKIDIFSSCGGMGTCGTCRVVVQSSLMIEDRSELELEMATDRGFKKEERLSCQIHPLCEMKILIPKLTI